MAGLGYWYVEIEKQAYWRGLQHYWVNRYVMSGSTPAASAGQGVIEALQAIENVLMPDTGANAGVGFVEGRAYPSGGGYPFTTVDYNSSKAVDSATGFAGGTFSSQVWAPELEVTLDIQTPLAGLSKTGKPVYLRKFLRGICQTGISPEAASGFSAQALAEIDAVVKPWTTGLGANNYVVISPDGRQSSGPPTAQAQLGNHQIPRGRKRKTSSTSSVTSRIVAGLEEGLTASAAASLVELLL